MSEADSKLLSEMFSLVKNIDSRLDNLESQMTDVKGELQQINKRLDEQSEMIEANFVDLKETQTVVEIHSQKLKAIK